MHVLLYAAMMSTTNFMIYKIGKKEINLIGLIIK